MNKRYFLSTFLLALIGSPLLLSAALLVAGMLGWFLWVILLPLGLVMLSAMWVCRLEREDLPDCSGKRYLPIVLAFSYYMLLWIIVFATAGYNLRDGLFNTPVFTIFTFPHILLLEFFDLTGKALYYPLFLIGFYGLIWLTMVIAARIKNCQPTSGRGLPALLGVCFLLCAVTVYQLIDRARLILDGDVRIEKVEEEVPLWQYKPFDEDNLLTPLDEPCTLSIESGYPRLDGATAAYPVYASMVEMVYRGLDTRSAEKYVACNNTPDAYRNLIKGEVDVIFGVHPSEQQIAAAKARGKEFVLTPIAAEAFVFFVNTRNPVTNLTVEQIRGIYLKKTTNWRELGGENARIIPFQRPVDSGSQTAMISLVMGGDKLPAPILEELAMGMGRIINQVAAYRNYSSSIGYSFRYYATGMKRDEGIRLISINGIKPTPENIRTGAYPFTVHLYAVTTGNESANTKKLIEWLLSPQGQRLVERCGYVPVSPTGQPNDNTPAADHCQGRGVAE